LRALLNLLAEALRKRTKYFILCWGER